MKIVLDTNCLVNVIMPGSYNNEIWQAFRAAKYVLCVTNEILFEYHEILAKYYNVVIANTMTFLKLMSASCQNFLTLSGNLEKMVLSNAHSASSSPMRL